MSGRQLRQGWWRKLRKQYFDGLSRRSGVSPREARSTRALRPVALAPPRRLTHRTSGSSWQSAPCVRPKYTDGFTKWGNRWSCPAAASRSLVVGHHAIRMSCCGESPRKRLRTSVTAYAARALRRFKLGYDMGGFVALWSSVLRSHIDKGAGCGQPLAILLLRGNRYFTRKMLNRKVHGKRPTGANPHPLGDDQAVE